MHCNNSYRSNSKILNCKENVQKVNDDGTDKTEKSTDRLANSCHNPDLVQAFSNKNCGLINNVLRQAKPLNYMTSYTTFSKQAPDSNLYKVNMVEYSFAANIHLHQHVWHEKYNVCSPLHNCA